MKNFNNLVLSFPELEDTVKQSTIGGYDGSSSNPMHNGGDFYGDPNNNAWTVNLPTADLVFDRGNNYAPVDQTPGSGGYYPGFGGSPDYSGGAGGSGSPSSMTSGSAFAGYTGLVLSKNAALLNYTAQEARALEDIASALKATKVLVIAGKTIGVVGAVFTAYEGATDGNGFTWGDGAKVGIGLVATFTPAGWAYGVIDISTGIITGTTLTDRIGNAIDSQIDGSRNSTNGSPDNSGGSRSGSGGLSGRN